MSPAVFRLMGLAVALVIVTLALEARLHGKSPTRRAAGESRSGEASPPKVAAELPAHAETTAAVRGARVLGVYDGTEWSLPTGDEARAAPSAVWRSAFTRVSNRSAASSAASEIDDAPTPSLPSRVGDGSRRQTVRVRRSRDGTLHPQGTLGPKR
jgi:hypothetical protein